VSLPFLVLLILLVIPVSLIDWLPTGANV